MSKLTTRTHALVPLAAVVIGALTLMPRPAIAAPLPTAATAVDVDAGQWLAQAGGADVTAAKACKKRRGKFHFQFEEAGIFDVLKQISLLTCKNFIVSESIKGAKKELTIISRTPVNVDQAYSAFLSALEANNMALVPAGQFLKVVERKDAAKDALPMYEKKPDGSIGLVEQGATISFNDAQITYVAELGFSTADQVQPLLRNLMSKSGDLQVVGQNLLIITDSAANVRRIMSILDRVDVAGAGSRIHVVNIEYADVQQIAQKLTDIFGQAAVKGGKPKPAASPAKPVPPEGGAAPAPEGAGGESDDIQDVSIEKIVADERTNKLLIIASKRAFEHIKELIDVLDVPGEGAGTGTQVYVHPLNNADAQKIASTLTGLAQGAGANKAGAKAKAGGDKEAASLFEGDVKVTADESTNSLVIIASARDYRSLRRVIEELDVQRPQVFVEAAILEVSLNQNRSFGVDAYTGLPFNIPGLGQGDGLAILANEGGQKLVTSSAKLAAAQSLLGQVNANVLDASQLATAAELSSNLEGLLGWAALQGPAIDTGFGFPVPSFGMVINALQNNANVDVLSTPHIMTTDNEKAEISVGKRVPVVRGISNLGGGSGGFGFGALQQIQYEDVKLKFMVTPHVNDDDDIRLEIEQEVSDLGEQVPVGNDLTQPVITNRTAKTTVVIRDQQTMVLGGLIASRRSDSERKFPILGDIPIIGWLFKDWRDDESKTNLIIVLTPYVVRGEGDLGKIYDRKMKEREEFIEAYYGTAAEYSPYVDYDKKTGPLGDLLKRLDNELMKAENGGPGLPGEQIITPEVDVTPFGSGELEGASSAGEESAPADEAAPESARAPASEGDDFTPSDEGSDADEGGGEE